MDTLTKKLEKAYVAKATAMRRFGDAKGINGIGVSRRGNGYAVKINFSNDPDVAIPNKINNIDVIVEVVGKIRKFAPKSTDVAYHVVPHKGRWAIRKQGAGRVSSTHRTQREAIGVARERARKKRGELVVHAPDGSIRDRDTYREA